MENLPVENVVLQQLFFIGNLIRPLRPYKALKGPIRPSRGLIRPLRALHSPLWK